MLHWLQNQIEKWRETRKIDAQQRLHVLTARYHIFRSILDTNSRAVELITEIDMGLRGAAVSYEGLSQKIDELLAATYDLVEKLNELDYDRHKILFARHQKIANEIKNALSKAPKEGDIPLCIPLGQIQIMSAAYGRLAGNKASVLARLMASDIFHVPQGFVIPVHACRLFLERSALTFKIIRALGRYLNIRQGETLKLPAQVVDDVKKEIIATPLPKVLEEALISQGLPFLSDAPPGLAVRSSAIGEDGLKHSFAGQFATVLNVTNPADLILAFKEVVASNFNTRSLAYRLNAGMNPLDFNMAVLCLKMIDAISAGILFTKDPNNPDSGHMLISAVFGLGELAVAGESSADIYRPSRSDTDGDLQPFIAKKDKRLALDINGGVRLEDVPEAERLMPVLTPGLIKALVGLGLQIERLQGGPQDIEWAIDKAGVIFILQSRPLKIMAKQATYQGQNSGKTLFDKAVVASRGMATGRVLVARGKQDLERPIEAPIILVLHQSLVDAARVVKDVNGVLVDIGNPADHLSCVAREQAIPMLTGLATATKDLKDGDWITVDAVSGRVTVSAQSEIDEALKPRNNKDKENLQTDMYGAEAEILKPFQKTLQALLVKLNLTDAYGPTFSIMECRSIHDIVRFVHEKAVIAMFDMGDELLSDTKGLVYSLESDIPFLLSMIDLGGGLVPKEGRGLKITPKEIVSVPFKALWKGITTPELRWSNPPASEIDIGQTYSRWITDQQSERPVGYPNYVIISRDYMNLNARMDFHFVMIDTVCGLNPMANYLRFRFKGGGTSLTRRKRRAGLIAELLERHDFFVDLKDDLINGELSGVAQSIIEEKLVFLGRLLGFTRLLDMAMADDQAPHEIAMAFIAGDYQLKGIAKR
jgi:pyruvate,water dikinase